MVDKPRTDSTDNILRLMGVDPSFLKKEPPAKPGAAPSVSLPATEVDDLLSSIGVDLSDDAPSGKVPETAPPPRLGPAAEAEARRISKTVTPLLPVAEGVPVIGTLPRHITAAAAASIQPRTGMGMPGEGFGQRFQANEDVLRRASELYSQDNPLWSVVGNVLGGTMATLPLAATGPGAAILGMRGPSIPIRAVTGGLSGGGIGGADAIARGDDPLTGLEIGAAGGALSPLISGGARAGTRFISEVVLPPRGDLAGVMRPNINRLAAALESETPQSIQAAREFMGPRGMLADINPATRDLAIGAANRPGPGKSVMHEAIRNRSATQAGRLNTALDTHVAPNIDIEGFKNYTTEARKAAADPLYAQWRETKIEPTGTLEALLPRLKAAGAFKNAQQLAKITGDATDDAFFDGMTQAQGAAASRVKYSPTAQTWDYVKRGLDSAIDKAYTKGDNTKARALVGLRNELVDEIEKTPAGAIWKQARQEWADRSEILDQIERGRDTFLGSRSGNSVAELRDEIKGLSGPALQARIQGMRSAIDDVMGETMRGDTTLRNKLLAPNNIKKMELMIGKDRTDKLVKTLQEEKFYGEQRNAIIGGSDTAPKSEAVRALDAAPASRYLENIDFTRPASMIPSGVRQALTPAGWIDAYRGQTNEAAVNQLAHLLSTPEGKALERLLRGLATEGQRRARVDRAASTGENLLGSLISVPGTTTARRHYFPSERR